MFGYPGGAILGIYEALYACPEIRHTLCTHEQHAAHAADGYARASGKVGVCFATSGPGATNLLTGLSAAYMDSSPVVAITNNVARAQIGTDSFQEIDIYGVSMPVTKHNYIIKDISELADTLRDAFLSRPPAGRGLCSWISPRISQPPRGIPAPGAQSARAQDPGGRAGLCRRGVSAGRERAAAAAHRGRSAPLRRGGRGAGAGGKKFERPLCRRSWPPDAPNTARVFPECWALMEVRRRTRCWLSATCSSPWAHGFPSARSPAPKLWLGTPKFYTSTSTRRRSIKISRQIWRSLAMLGRF